MLQRVIHYLRSRRNRCLERKGGQRNSGFKQPRWHRVMSRKTARTSSKVSHCWKITYSFHTATLPVYCRISSFEPIPWLRGLTEHWSSCDEFQSLKFMLRNYTKSPFSVKRFQSKLSNLVRFLDLKLTTAVAGVFQYHSCIIKHYFCIAGIWKYTL